MIGNGVAALASTTALASGGKDTSASRQGGNGFAETLDQALKGNRQSTDTMNSANTGDDTVKPSAQSGTSHRGIVFAESRWGRSAESATVDQSGEEPEPAVSQKTSGDAKADAASLSELVGDNKNAPAADRGDSREIRAAGPTANDGQALDGTTAAKAEMTKSDSITAAENGPASATSVPDVAARKGDADETRPRARTEQSATATKTSWNGSQAPDQHPVAAKSGEHALSGQTRTVVDQAGADAATARTANVSLSAETNQDAARTTVVDGSNNSVMAGQPAARARDKAVGEPGAKIEQSAQRRQAAEMPANAGNVDMDRGVRSSDKVLVKHARSENSTTPVESRRPVQVPGSATVVQETSQADPIDVVDSTARAAPRATPSEQASRLVTRTRIDGNGVAQPNSADKPIMTLSGIQSVPTTATGADTAPANQIATAVSRDLEALGPSRISLSTAGSPNRPLKSIQLQLNPAELGSVNIRLQSVDGELRVSIRAENDQTAQMLSRDSDAIRSALRAAGISGPEITVSVNRNDSGTQPQTNGQNRDAFGQQSGGHENRENMPNESRHSNRDHSSHDTAGSAFSRDDLDPGDGNRNDRVFI